ncbi:hypothetical protein [Microbacterium sp. Root61]|nr:hypothetical protein [Microbacterium sp. Root61]
MIDSQLASDILLGIIGLLALVGLLGTVGAFWSLGRSAYRKE